MSMARLREYAKKNPEQVGSRLRQFRAQAMDEDRWGLTAEPVTLVGQDAADPLASPPGSSA